MKNNCDKVVYMYFLSFPNIFPLKIIHREQTFLWYNSSLINGSQDFSRLGCCKVYFYKNYLWGKQVILCITINLIEALVHSDT